ncbi:MAG: GTP pyrophosphokinase family protein [Actinomycetales bacterium]|nr:GTP pyrophosphokinase family protein [Actinomycetales bacterium]
MSPTPDSALSPSGALAAFLAEREPAEADRLLLELRRLAMTYKFGIDEVMTKISILREEFRHLRLYNPVEHVGSRLKSFDSILAKCRRKGIELDPDAIRAQMFDIAGVRVTCSFVSDIYRVRDMLVGQTDLTVLEERDYIAAPKPNGYKSLHLIVKVPVFLSDRVEDVVVEIQLRTIAMDFWASLEHKIYYHYDRTVPTHLTDALKLAADTAWSLDTAMERIHEEMKEIRNGDVSPQELDDLLDPTEQLRQIFTDPPE